MVHEALDLAAIRADCATLKPRERASTLTDAQERLLYEAVPALLAEVERLRAVLFDTQAWVTHDAECASWRALRCTCEAGPMLDRIYAALDGTP